MVPTCVPNVLVSTSSRHSDLCSVRCVLDVGALQCQWSSHSHAMGVTHTAGARIASKHCVCRVNSCSKWLHCFYRTLSLSRPVHHAAVSTRHPQQPVFPYRVLGLLAVHQRRLLGTAVASAARKLRDFHLATLFLRSYFSRGQRPGEFCCADRSMLHCAPLHPPSTLSHHNLTMCGRCSCSTDLAVCTVCRCRRPKKRWSLHCRCSPSR